MFDRIFIFAIVFVVMMGPHGQAHAYLDPGTGSIMLQMLLGGLAGAAVIAKIYWHRFVSLFRSKKSLDGEEQRNLDD